MLSTALLVRLFDEHTRKDRGKIVAPWRNKKCLCKIANLKNKEEQKYLPDKTRTEKMRTMIIPLMRNKVFLESLKHDYITA